MRYDFNLLVLKTNVGVLKSLIYIRLFFSYDAYKEETL